MWCLRALAVAAVAVPLLVGTGCVTQRQYDRDIGIERDKTTKALKDLDQAKRDLKKDDATIADLSMKATDMAKVQEQLADERKLAESLQASIKIDVEKAKKAQERADQEKLGMVSRNSATQLAKAREQIAELRKEVEKLRKEVRTAPSRSPTPPVSTPVTPPVSPVTPPAAPPCFGQMNFARRPGP